MYARKPMEAARWIGSDGIQDEKPLPQRLDLEEIGRGERQLEINGTWWREDS